MPDTTPMQGDRSRSPVGRVELLALLAILLCGFALRIAFPARMAVEHFDEGVYASNFFSSAEAGFRYPFRHLYAPPLLPALVEAGIMLFGPGGIGPMLVNIVAGSLTVLLLWQVGRRWFGPSAGLTAAALCAFSDFHLLYSRTVLTDPLLGLAMLAAVHCLWQTHRTRDARWGLAAAVACGIAWWTKYNGWLPLAVGISGVAAWQVFTRSPRRSFGRHLLIWGGIAMASMAVWSPVWFGLQTEGGYSVVASNHRQYLVGFAGWADSLRRHVEVHRYFEGWLTCAGFLVAGLAVAVVARRHSPTQKASSLPIIATAAFAAGLAAAIGAGIVTGLLAAAGLLFQTELLPRRAASSTSSDDEAARDRRLAAWLLAAWFVGLALTTPLYRPYPRLGLPWLISAWLGCGALVEFAICRVSHPSDGMSRRRALLLGIGVCGILLLVVFSGRLTRHNVAGWQRRDAFVDIADEIVKRASKAEPGDTQGNDSLFVVYVFGEPGLYYQLAAAADRHSKARYVVAPVSSLEFPLARVGSQAVATYLVVGPHARRTPGFDEQWRRLRDRFEPVGDPLPYAASDLVLLNEYSPAEIDSSAARPTLEVALFRMRPEAGGR